MKKQIPTSIILSNEIRDALAQNMPIVALESAVITHGLPYPTNLELAQEVEEIIRNVGAVPATIAMMDGKIHIGLSNAEIERLSACQDAIKLSTRNLGIGIAANRNGGTTVAATLFAAHAVGISVFATGGIGGVHRGTQFDVSADLDALSKTPVIVVCAGIKSILDIPATLEVLETKGVPVLGYQSDVFPAFYSKDSGCPVDIRVDNPSQIADIAQAHWNLGLNSSLLVGLPLPENSALNFKEIDDCIKQALVDAESQKVSGAKMTPFLLDRVSKLSKGRSLQANLILLKNNARLAAEIAKAVTQPKAQSVEF